MGAPSGPPPCQIDQRLDVADPDATRVGARFLEDQPGQTPADSGSEPRQRGGVDRQSTGRVASRDAEQRVRGFGVQVLRVFPEALGGLHEVPGGARVERFGQSRFEGSSR
jgi:hypothetical protein